MVGTLTRRGTTWRQGIYLQVAFPESMKEEGKKVGISCAERRARVVPSIITPYVLSSSCVHYGSRAFRGALGGGITARLIEVFSPRCTFNTRPGISFG